MTSAFKKFSFSAFTRCLLDFDQVNIDEIPRVVHIQSFAVLVNKRLVERKHFFTIPSYFFLSLSFSGKILQK